MNPSKYISNFFEAITCLPNLFLDDPFGFKDEIEKTYLSLLYEPPKQEEPETKKYPEKERC